MITELNQEKASIEEFQSVRTLIDNLNSKLKQLAVVHKELANSI
mgnify:CR=1 FL=1